MMKDVVVVQLLSLMSRSQNKTFRSPDIYALPEKGHLIAIDTEFVTVAKEDAVLNSDGSRTVNSAARQVCDTYIIMLIIFLFNEAAIPSKSSQALARVSAIDGTTGNVIIDDYVVPREPIIDYKTRFSGLISEDLDPNMSSHHLVHLRTAYLKLRLLVSEIYGSKIKCFGLNTNKVCESM